MRTVGDLRDKVIEIAVVSVLRYEDRIDRREGCLEGLRIASQLDNPDEFRMVMAARQQAERDMRHRIGPADQAQIEAYWRHRCATLQIEFVFERLKVAWGLPGPLSAAAVLQVSDLMGWRRRG